MDKIFRLKEVADKVFLAMMGEWRQLPNCLHINQ